MRESRVCKVGRIAGLFVLIMMLAGLGHSCGTKQPGVVDTRFNKPLTDHTRFTAPCASCHEETRLPASADIDIKTGLALTVPHGFGRSCDGCHQYDPAAPSWRPVVHLHTPADVSCFGCHTLAGEAATHPARGDCISCHAFPTWKVGQ